MFRAHLIQSRRATRRGKSKNGTKFAPRAFRQACLPIACEKPVPRALGASLGRPGSAFGRLLGTLGLPGASPDWPWGIIWGSKSRLERVRTRPRNDFGRPNQPKIDFSLILGRFGVDFRRFSNDISSIFARVVCDKGTKAESQGVA